MHESFEQYVKRSRKALDLTQHELAGRVGCSESTLRKIEAGTLRPSRQIAERLAICLEVPVSERQAFITAARRTTTSSYSQNVPRTSAPQPEVPPRLAGFLGFPTPLSVLIGRSNDLIATNAILLQSEVRLLTLIGPPGVGKTRLAVQMAAALQDHFQDGVVFIPLASVDSYDVMLTTIAQAVGVQEQSGHSIADALISFFQEKQLLLVLDNLEQLATVCNPLTNLLRSAPRLKMLCTSRVLLHLAGEHSYIVKPLDCPVAESTHKLADIVEAPAIALFTACIQRHQPDFRLTAETAGFAIQLCQHLDGIPLAIELAAAQIRLFTIGELLNQFNRLGSAKSLRLLRFGPHHSAQQTTLWDTIASSYALLSEPARAVFRALALFPGGCTIDAALAVCSTPHFDHTTILGALAELVDASLVERLITPTQESRLRMFETIRAFAQASAEVDQHDQGLPQRYFSYYRSLATKIETGVIGAEQRHWLARIIAEQPNFRAVLTNCLNSENANTRLDALSIAAALWWGWWACGYGAEARQWLQQALNKVAGETELHATAWYASAALACFAGDAPLARLHIANALTLARAQHNQSCEAHALIFSAVLTAFNGDPAAGVRQIEASIALFRTGSPIDHWGLGLALMSQRVFAIYQGDYSIARAAAEEALVVFSVLGQPYSMSLALNSLGDLARLQHDSAVAAERYHQALTLLRASGVTSELPSMLHNCAYAELRCNRLELSADCLREALRMNQRIGHKAGIAECLTGCAGLAILTGEDLQATEWFGTIDALYALESGPSWPAERLEYDHYRALVQARIGDDAFTNAYALGRIRRTEAVVAEVLAWLTGFVTN